LRKNLTTNILVKLYPIYAYNSRGRTSTQEVADLKRILNTTLLGLPRWEEKEIVEIEI
jgi:hypothetical protein